MEQYIMKGGNPLVGEVTISGAKNAALGILTAAVMTDDDVVVENVHLSESLMRLSYRVCSMQDQEEKERARRADKNKG